MWYDVESSKEPRFGRRGDDDLEAGAANKQPDDEEDLIDDDLDGEGDDEDDDEDDDDLEDGDDDLIDLDDEYDDADEERDRPHPPHHKFDD